MFFIFVSEKWAVARKLGIKPKYRNVSKTFVSILGIFIPVMRESVEMLYQYDKDCIFKSDKFEIRFSYTPTSYLEGIKEIIRSDYQDRT